MDKIQQHPYSSLVEWVGAIHMHSIYSDGLAKVPRIINAAKKIGLDYCILTDHNTLRAKDEGYPGYYDDLLFLIGSEVTCSDNSHLLALKIDEVITPGIPPQRAIDSVVKQEGFSILAHAFDQGSPFFKTYYPWKDWSVKRYNAIEIWNFLTDWSENIKNIFDVVYGYLCPIQYLDGPPPEAFRRWNELNTKRFNTRRAPVVIIGSVDAHGYFPYSKDLASIHTHIWCQKKTGSLAIDRKNLFTNLGMGRAFIANDWLYPAKGFTFTAHGKSGQYPHKPVIGGPALINVQAPTHGQIRLFLNEELIECKEGRSLEYEAQKAGTYRVEVYYSKSGILPGPKGYKPWIFSNAVSIRLD